MVVTQPEVIGPTPITLPTSNTPMTLITPGGDLATTKPKHEPRAFRRDRDQLQNEHDRLLNEFIEDISPQEGKPEVAKADVQAARRKYGHEYAETVHKLKAGNITLNADDQLLYKAIDSILEQMDRKIRLSTAIDQLPDGLEYFDFREVGDCLYGKLWLSVNGVHWVALAVGTTGLTTLFFDIGPVPPLLQEINAQERFPQCRQARWTMAEVTMILRAMRWQKTKKPEDHEVKAASAITKKKHFRWF